MCEFQVTVLHGHTGTVGSSTLTGADNQTPPCKRRKLALYILFYLQEETNKGMVNQKVDVNSQQQMCYLQQDRLHKIQSGNCKPIMRAGCGGQSEAGGPWLEKSPSA